MTAAESTRWVVRACCLLFGTILVCLSAFGIEPSIPSSVDVYWKSSRAISAPGVTSVVVLDEDVARAQLGNDEIEFVGLARGETVALAFVKGSPVSIVVRIIEHPVAAVPPSLLRRQAEMAHGVIGSEFQVSRGNSSSFVALSSLSWSQQTGDAHLDVNSLVEDNSQFAGHSANLRTGGISYRTPQLAVNILDFNQTVTGELPEDHINNFSSPGVTELRGAGVTLSRGRNEYGFFAGTTLPYYFLALDATRDVAGISFHRKATEKLNVFGSAAYVNIPTNFFGPTQRRDYFMQNTGMSYRIGKGFQFGAQVGVSNAGKLWRLDGSYSSFRFSGYASAISASQTFPMMQLQSLFAGTSAIRGGLSYRLTPRLTQGLYFDHTEVVPGLVYRVAGRNDYISPDFAFRISNRESLNIAYTYSQSSGGFIVGKTTGNRYDVSLDSQLTPHVFNNAQLSLGSIQDPLQINSEDRFIVRDTVSFPIKGQTILLGVEHDRVDPSLVGKISQEIGLLSPVLQAEFQANPIAFVDSASLPPEIKALLAAEQPTGTTVSAGATLAIGSKFHVNPNMAFTHSLTGLQTESWTQSFGYSLTYQLRPTLQLRSSLNNIFLWDSHQNSVVRTMVLSAGFQKTFTTAPGELPLLHRGRIIEGRVFRDNNINGYFNAGEPGLQGVEVRLDDEQVAITDELGRYKFSSLSADQHHLSVAITQFHHPVRMTTKTDVDVDLIQHRVAVMNFGVLDFSRVMGNIYNDLRFDNTRQPDSRGMQDIQLLLDNGKEVRKIQTTGSGDFELDDVPPGDYKLALDLSSIPPNYITPLESVAIHVGPVSTVVRDIPLRALRSISGTVLLKTAVPSQNASEPSDPKRAKGLKPGSEPVPPAPSQEFKLVPVAGVQIAAGTTKATTDADGKFLLRNLPAGELKVTVTPVKPVPAGMNIPSGLVKLPAEPVQVQGATIVISNSDLLPYLSREFHNGSESRAPESGGANTVPPVEAKPVAPDLNSATQPTREPAGAPTASFIAPHTVEPEPRVTPDESIDTLPAITSVHTTVQPATEADATAAPPVPQLMPRADIGSAAPSPPLDGVLTREVCNQLPSLGEIAQCLRQLKLNSSAKPK